MNPPATRHWLLIVEGDVEPFLIGPVDESDLLLRAREHRANDLSAEDGLYAISLDAEGDLRIEGFAHAQLASQDEPRLP